MLYSRNTTIRIHIYIYTNISGNIVSNNDDFNERTKTLLYKNISLILYSRKGWCWLCVRSELETGTDCYIMAQSSSDHSSTSFASWLGCSTAGHWGPQSLSLQADSHAGILSPTDSNCDRNWTDSLELELELELDWHKPSVASGYIIVCRPPASCGRTHLQRI